MQIWKSMALDNIKCCRYGRLRYVLWAEWLVTEEACPVMVPETRFITLLDYATLDFVTES